MQKEVPGESCKGERCKNKEAWERCKIKAAEEGARGSGRGEVQEAKCHMRWDMGNIRKNIQEKF